jgi:DNA-binding MarR family transcriptional regulator
MTTLARTQLETLAALGNEEISAASVARRLQLSRSSSALGRLEKLESRGLVSRRRNAKPQLFRLTTDGLAALIATSFPDTPEEQS